MNHWWLLFLLNLPLLQEVTRKYLIYSDFVFLGADVLSILTAIALALQGKLNLKALPPVFCLLAPLFIVWTSFNHGISGNHIGIYGIGLRATFLPLIYMLISAQYLSAVSNGYERILVCVNVWILIIGTMALLQLFLGENHPINMVWGTMGLGIGDYTTQDKGILLPGLFRPTSIFTHTGKFGQVIFTLVLFKWCYLAFSQIKRSPFSYLLIVFDLIVIFASGQRAGLTFLISAVAIIAALCIQQNVANIGKLIVGASIILGAVLLAAMVQPKLAMAVYDRFASTITSIPIRLEGNFWLPMKTMLDSYLFMGEGLGSFTFGSHLFGGTLVYRAIKMEGLGESSLIRFCGEVGVMATVILVIAYLALVGKGLKVSRDHKGTPLVAGALFYCIWIVSLMLWSNTADVFANSVVATLGYALSGAVLARPEKILGDG
jgi:hypothetical protein